MPTIIDPIDAELESLTSYKYCDWSGKCAFFIASRRGISPVAFSVSCSIRNMMFVKEKKKTRTSFSTVSNPERARVKRGGSVGASAVGSIDHLASKWSGRLVMVPLRWSTWEKSQRAKTEETYPYQPPAYRTGVVAAALAF